MASPFSPSVVSSSRSQLSEIFCEFPVTLTEFVQSPTYLNNPPLSPIQYDAVRHIEQVFRPETYVLMEDVLGEYWNPVRHINYATLVFGKGCILPHERVYDPVRGAWDRVDSLTSEGVVSCYDPDEEGDLKTRPRTSASPQGYGECVRVTLADGDSSDVYAGHKFLTPDGWTEARFLRKKSRVLSATTLTCEEPQRYSNDLVAFAAHFVGRGFFSEERAGALLKPVLRAPWLELLERLGEEELFLRAHWRLQDYRSCHPESFARLSAIASGMGIESLDRPISTVPEFVFSLPLDQLSDFFYILWQYVGTAGATAFASNEGFRSGVFLRFRSSEVAVSVKRLLLRFGSTSSLSTYNMTRRLDAYGLLHRDEKHKNLRRSELGPFWRLSFNILNETALFFDALLYSHGDDEKFVRYRSECKTDETYQIQTDTRWLLVSEVTSLGMGEYWNFTVPDGGNYVAGNTVHANSGKDHVSRVASLRVVYLLQCLHDPQGYYGMPSQDTIHLLNVASARAQATRAYFTPLTKLVRSSPWFQNKCDVKQDLIVWEKNIEMISGHSEAESQEGLNLLVGVADEVDGFKSKDAPGARTRDFVNSAENIIEMLHTSARTRFPDAFKVVHISYPRYVGSPILKLLERGKEDQEEMGAASRYYTSGPHATWDVHPNRTREQFEDDYKKDRVMARTKYECKPERAIDPYFRNTQAIKSCMREDDSPLSVSYSLGNESGAPVWRADHDFGTLSPKEGALYVIHADLALRNDRAGLAMAHVLDWQDVMSITTDEDGSETEMWESRPNLYVDFAIGYEADLSQKPEREIQIRWVRQLVLELRRRGFNIALVSYDQFQSADSMQILHTQGIRTKKVSADRDDSVWRNLRDLMYEGRISLPDSPLLYNELTSLMKMPSGKIDHPTTSGKDLADAVACASLSAVLIGGAETGEDTDDSVFETAAVYDSYPIGFPEAPSGMDLYGTASFSRYTG